MNTSEKIDEFVAGYADWRGDYLARLRKLINQTEPELTEDWKWSVPVWTLNGKPVCAISGFKDHVKINFFKGASLPDPDGVFNSGLDSKEHRSINFAEGDQINEHAIQALVHAAKAQV